jgi:hypothetical protein
MRIRIEHFDIGHCVWMRIRIQIQGFDDQELEKLLSLKKNPFFCVQIFNLLIPRLL